MRVRVPVCAPVAAGVKVTLTVQEDDAARDVPQLSVSPNCALAAMLENVIAVVPLLVTVTACDVLVVVRTWLLKVRVAGLTVRLDGEVREIL